VSFGAQGSGFRIGDLELRVYNSGSKQGPVYRAYGFGFRVDGYRLWICVHTLGFGV
jgi:hypothetical protein